MFNSIRSLTAVAGFFRAAFFISALGLSGATLSAQEAGTLSGRVTDQNTRLALSGARVVVKGTGHETYTDQAGDYVLAGVPSGAQSVEFGYVGYSEQILSVEIAARATTRLNATFGSETVQLDKFVIEGSLVGTARAINQQRASATFRSIVASDEIGNFPDQNAAESIQRIPGVSLYRDQGEGRYIVLRGLNYTFTSVKVNGGSFAGADLGERATALDVIPSDALASIEVTKVPTPDMDGEGLGGQVNIKTKSPFDSEGLAASFTAQGQYADQSGEFSEKFNGYVSQRFGDHKQYGILISPTWQVRKFGSYNYETGGAWSSPADNGTPFYVAQALEFRDYVIERERYGLNAALEARPDSETSLYFRGGYNRFTDSESRHLTIFDFAEGTLVPSSVTANSATYNALRRYGRRLRIREKDQEVYTFNAGGEKRFGGWVVDAQAGYTEGNEKRPDEITARFRRNTRDAVIRYDTVGAYGLSVTQLAGASFLDPASYNFQRVDLGNEVGSEKTSDIGFNARYDFNGITNPTYLKIGSNYRAKEKDAEGEVYELATAPTSFTFANLAEPASDYPYLRVPRLNTAAVREVFYANRSAFTGARVFEDSEFEDFSLSEDVLAAYAMGGTQFGKLNVIAGLRVERTEFETTGNEVDLVDETSVKRTASNNYTNWLPGVYFRYDATKQLVLRASWSNSIARPSFGDTAFRSAINSDDLEITRGNPNLKSLEATNWDASAEYYLPSLGVVSAAVFHKQIENFSYEFDADTPVVINGESYDLTTYANGSDGTINGLELAYQQQLRFLPAPFDGLGFMANITFLDSEATYPTRPGEDVPFIGQSDRTGNVGLTYEKAGFFARLAMNFRSERLREDEPLGGAAENDLYVDDFKQLDLTLRYKISRNWEVFAEALNLTDEPFRVFLKSPNGQGARLGQVEEYGWSANFGVRWKL
ncbi:TonB-dependent receptor [Oleiharenicola lentus]|uniref:TonB-dependent receptor n=1 Tax=Oleiharenicola lentus TaxID=2508720 RepID=UPI003F670480